jgi:hypothetical protein
MGKPEAEVEGYLLKRVKALGGETRKVTWIGHRGAPDRFVMLPGEFSLNFWAECKRSRAGVVKLHQDREHAKLTAYGEIVYVLDSKEAVDNALAECMRTPR